MVACDCKTFESDMTFDNGTATPSKILSPLYAFVIVLTPLLVTGCLGDDRCGPGQRLEGIRCIPVLEAGPLHDSSTAEQSNTDGGFSDAQRCLFKPTIDQLKGTFGVNGKINESNCTLPFTKAGDSIDGELKIVRKGNGLSVTLNAWYTSLEGTATLQPSGPVLVNAAGILTNLDINIASELCFTDLNNANSNGIIRITSQGNPVCVLYILTFVSRK